MIREKHQKHCLKKHGTQIYRWLGLCKKCWIDFGYCHYCWAGNGDGIHHPCQHIEIVPLPFRFNK